jgi:predicted ATPase
LDSFVYQESEGNPLFIVAMLEHLIAQRNLVRLGTDDSARWECPAPFSEMETGVPNELSQMIELEIGRLSPREQRILEAASLSNVAFPAWAVAAALEEDSDEIEEACDRLARQLYFMRRAGHDELPDGSRSAFYVFAHGLYREVLYQRQPATRRARGHVRIAERLGTLFAGRQADVAREIAMHYEAAGNWQSATDALREAARHAKKRHAYSEAAQLLEHTLCVAENLSAAGRDAVAKEIRSELAIARNAMEGTGRRREMSKKA